MRVRYSDNVLESNEWTVARLTVGSNKVESVVVEHQGVYDASRLLGLTLEVLEDMLNEDPTGSHPEQYFEVWLGNDWRSIGVEVEDLRNL